MNEESKKSQNSGWEHSEVEDWKLSEKEFFDPYHLKNFRRSTVSGGVLNPPDRPRKISAKYHGINHDVKDWFSGVSIYDKLRCLPNFLLQFFKLKSRLKRTKSYYKIQDILDNKTGNPSALLNILGVTVTEASVRYWYYTSRITALVGQADVIVEIGSGYGGLAERLAVSLHAKKYVLVDLPETLSIAASYLRQRGLKVFEIISVLDLDQIKNQDGYFLCPPYLLPDLKDFDSDLFVNTMSFQHMTKANLNYYFNSIKKFRSKHIYFVNRTIKRDESDVLPDDYPLPKGYSLELDDPWIHENFVERHYVRVKSPK